VPTAMNVDAGTVVLGLVLDTLSGRSLLYRLEEFFAQHDTELLLGKAIPPQAFTDDTVGRVLDRLYDFGTMRLFTTCAVRASMRFGLERRSVPFVTTLCVDRAVSTWGKPEDGNASDTSLKTTLLSEIAQLRAGHGVAPGASIYMADAALVTEDDLAALGDPLFITPFPATYRACGRVSAEAVARNQWEDGGVLAQTPPPKHRPGTFSKGAEDVVTRYGTTSRAVVVPAKSHAHRGGAHGCFLPSAPRACALLWPWSRSAAAGLARWASCPLSGGSTAGGPGDAPLTPGWPDAPLAPC
jgi:hypothetical protein